MWLKVLVFVIVYLSFISIDIINAVTWPQCAEFVFQKYDTNLSREEKQFKQKLPSLFESYDCGNVSDVEKTLKSLEKYKISFTQHEKCMEKQILSPSQEIVSFAFIIFYKSI